MSLETAAGQQLRRPRAWLISSALFAAPVNRLITELARLPGIGQRTAQRLAFHLLSVSDEEALALADAIREVKETVGPLRGLLQPRHRGRPAASARTSGARRA